MKIFSKILTAAFISSLFPQLLMCLLIIQFNRDYVDDMLRNKIFALQNQGTVNIKNDNLIRFKFKVNSGNIVNNKDLKFSNVYKSLIVGGASKLSEDRLVTLRENGILYKGMCIRSDGKSGNCTFISINSLKDNVTMFANIMILIIIISTTVVLIAVYIVSRHISKPLEGLTNYVASLTPENLDFNFNIKSNDEVGILVNQLKLYSDKLNEYRDILKKESSYAAIGRTSAMLAHDIRKPLTGLKSLINVLPQKQNDHEFVTNISRQVEDTINRTNSMLSEVLDFSKGTTNYNLRPIDPISLVTASISDVLTGKDDLEIKINYDIQSKNYLNVDGEQIIRVFTNIINNAVEAMSGKGSIWINIEDIMPRIRDDLTSLRTKIVVGNIGGIIPTEIRNKMFEPFFTHGKKKGTGLGLAICKKIIEDHGGNIEVHCVSDKTEFVFDLPAKEGNIVINKDRLIHHSNELKSFLIEEARREEYTDTENISEFLKLHKRRGRPSYVLIVDDEPLFRETVRSLLGSVSQVRDHVKVVEAADADTAFKLLDKQNFDYVIADIDLGRGQMNGYEMAQEVLKTYPDTYVLIHSNKRREEMDRELREIKSPKFMGFLPKPMKQSELLQFLACKTFEAKVKKEDKNKEQKKVLVVNDDDALLMSFKIMLKSSGVKVVTAEHVNEAMIAFKENNIDLILSDINLGDDEPSGYDFLKKVRETNTEVQFYMVSGYSQAEEEPKAKEMGANGYLQLPLEKEQLEGLL